MNKNIEYDKIKDAILNGKITEEYKAWLNQDKKNLEIEARIRKYYQQDSTLEVNDDEVENCWKEFKRNNFNKRRTILRITASVASVAAAVALLFISLNILPNEENIAIESEISESKPSKNITESKITDNIILKTENGKEYIINEKDIDFTKPSNNTAHQTKYQTIYVPKGKSFKIVLSDSSIVYLNNHTEFTYPVNFADNEERKVTLRGEAYFEVTKDTKNQFIVETMGIDIKVYGTKFNVNTNKYGIIETVLVEGSIAVQPDGSTENMVKPNQMLTYTTATNEIKLNNVDINNYISWMSGIYRFNRQSLKDIMAALSLWYDVEVIYEDDKIKELECICNIPRYTSIDEVLDILQKCGNIGYNINGSKIYMWSIK